jgi:hypothetical protein
MIGIRTIPLAYVIRPIVAVPPITAIAAGAPHSLEHKAIEIELVARANHTHPLYRDDNSTLYYKLEEATRATSYMPHPSSPFNVRRMEGTLGLHCQINM